MLSEVSSFFNDVEKDHKENNIEKWRKRVFYIFSYEFNYSQKDIEEMEIPFLFEMLDEREKDIKQQQKAIKRK